MREKERDKTQPATAEHVLTWVWVAFVIQIQDFTATTHLARLEIETMIRAQNLHKRENMREELEVCLRERSETGNLALRNVTVLMNVLQHGNVRAKILSSECVCVCGGGCIRYFVCMDEIL